MSAHNINLASASDKTLDRLWQAACRDRKEELGLTLRAYKITLTKARKLEAESLTVNILWDNTDRWDRLLTRFEELQNWAMDPAEDAIVTELDAITNRIIENSRKAPRR